VVRLRLERSLDVDVIVVGAGPAGAATAAHLVHAGRSVLMLDRRTFPRDKVCGDFVGPSALVELQRLGVTSYTGFPATVRIRRAALFCDGELLIRQDMPAVSGLPTQGRVIPRLQLDDWVLRAALDAGADLADGEQVVGYTVDAEGVQVTTGRGRRLRARALVGADGSTSLVARAVRGHKAAPENRIIAVRAYYEDVASPDDEALLLFGRESFPGYCWLFPTGPGTANVGIGMVLETVPPAGDRLAALLADTVARDPALSPRLAAARRVGRVAAWPLTTYDPREAVMDDRVVLVGDAAGLINPLNGEGIQYALASGRWAAEALGEQLAADDLSRHALGRYARTVRRELRYDMALAGLIVQLIRCRALTPVWFEALHAITARSATDAAYASAAGGILAGIVPANRALSTRVLGGTVAGAVARVADGAGPGMAVAAAGSGFALAFDAVRDPALVGGWLRAVLRGSAELVGQAAADTARRPASRQRSRSIM
jgi:geranylgeranyl reductase family protein